MIAFGTFATIMYNKVNQSYLGQIMKQLLNSKT